MTKIEFNDDPGMVSIAIDILKECASETDEDRCEAVYKLMKCIDDAAKARGLVFDR